MKKELACELCSSPATTYCESDRARLCWHCDSKVHKANFLVSKHNRTLLCHLCQNPTPWTASGPMLPPSLSICLSCASTTSSHATAATTTQSLSPHTPPAHLHHDENDGGYDSYDEEEDDEDDEEGYASDLENNVEEEEDDTQVVPLTSSVPSTIPDDDDEEEEVYDINDDGRISSMLPSALKSKRQFYLLS